MKMKATVFKKVITKKMMPILQTLITTMVSAVLLNLSKKTTRSGFDQLHNLN